ncbi:CobW family GTP-binding protein [Burkholderia alba]|uniref:CobW family GTP-binding protein n=1 Tax=Burkholderia alba TaxID=2683677 RepID=UPI002B060E09|nr:GTP-binding protein [Burkholderia alba]
MSLADDVIPVTLITGFLGSGKSTLLADLLEGEAARDTAVIVNEFGAIGLDHLLIGSIDAQTQLLSHGCLCCALRGELTDALTTLFSRRARGEVPPFSRVVLETSGLATPAPIIATLLGDPVVRGRYKLAGTLTVVDALNASWQRERHQEWLDQVSAADRLLISKADLVDESEVDALQDALIVLNPVASVMVRRLRADVDALREDIFALGDPYVLVRNLGRITHPPPSSRSLVLRAHQEGLAASRVTSFCLTLDMPLNWEVFTLWFTMVLNRHGDRILRVKGLLWPDGAERPAVLHAIRHVVYPVVHPPISRVELDGPRISRLVFITNDLAADALRASHQRFQHYFKDTRR